MRKSCARPFSEPRFPFSVVFFFGDWTKPLRLAFSLGGGECFPRPFLRLLRVDWIESSRVLGSSS